MYRPLQFFCIIGLILLLIGMGIGIRFLVFFFMGNGAGHIQSLILASMMIILGVMTGIVGLQADIISANRKILEDIQYHVKRVDYQLAKREDDSQDSKSDRSGEK